MFAKKKPAPPPEYGDTLELRCPCCGRSRLYLDGVKQENVLGVDIKYDKRFAPQGRVLLCQCRNCQAEWGMPSVVEHEKWGIG